MLPYANIAPLFAVSAEFVLVLILLVLAVLIGGAVGFWRMVGKGPRRERAYERSRELLAKGDWQGSSRAVEELRQLGADDPPWPGRLNNLEGECQRAAGDAMLAQGKYEEALDYFTRAAKLLGLSRDEGSNKIVEGMLSELRSRFAEADDAAATKLAQRILQLRSPCAEASFWLGMLHLRQNRPEQATQALRVAHESPDRTSVEPALYLGMNLLREGKPKDALRYLSDANRAAPNSVLVNWQLGMGLSVGGGDTSLAIRALQKSLAADGLPRLIKSPENFWREVLPNGAYIPKLNGHSPFVCPLLGGNLAGMIRQAKLALGQALFRADRAAEAANVFQDLANESEPTPPLLRALGIALCKLERYDEAYPQLRAAYEQDPTKNATTACYLAFCAAKAKPNRPEDKPANVRWAVRLLVDLTIPVELESAQMTGQVYAKARALGIPVPIDDQLRLCNTLVALNAADPIAAGAFDHLAATMFESVRPPYAFHYGRAAQIHGVRGERDLDLLEKVFKHGSMAQEYFESHGWSLAGVERLFLERWSEQHKGFPDVFGPDYPAKCETALLDQVRAHEQAGESDAARATIDLLRKLIPPNAATCDQLAKLAWIRGDSNEAQRLLADWITQEPANSTPHLRLAAIEELRGNLESGREHVRTAYDLASTGNKAHVAFVAAKLALRGRRLQETSEWLETGLKLNPANREAWALKAILAWRQHNQGEFGQLADNLDRSDLADPRLRYLVAAMRMQAGDLDGAHDTVKSLSSDPHWQVDADHLLGVIEHQRRGWTSAAAHLQSTNQASDNQAVNHTRALLGRVKLEQGEFTEAAALWSQVSTEKKQAWGITIALPMLVYVAGVQASQTGDDMAACEWFGKARELGLKEPRLGSLQDRAAVLAARRLESDPHAELATLLPLLDRAAKNKGSLQLTAIQLLARVYRRQNKLSEAREVLRRITPPPTPILMELGMVAVQDQQLSQAEECFARVLQDQPDNAAARYNLFWTRLSLGQTAAAQELTPELIREAVDPERRRLLTQIQILMQGGSGASALLGDMTVEEERRLIAALFAVSKLDATVPLLCVLAGARTHSPSAREAQTVGMIRLAKQRFDRGDWLSCEKWLSPLAKARPTASVRNLLGCCLCLGHDFAGGILHFQEALRLAGDDPRIHQNLALAFSWQSDQSEADLCWGRYLGTYNKRIPRPPGFIDYHEQLRFQVLRHLGNLHYERESWAEARAYLQEAHELRPEDADLAERLFLLQVQAGNRRAARTLLSELQQSRPKHSPFELYELDLIEVRNAADLERLLDALARVVERLIDDPSSQEKAVSRIWPQLQARADQLTRVLREIREDLHRLYEDSPGWYDALRDLRAVKKDLRRLRQILRYCASLHVNDSTRRKIDSLTEDLERKIDYCRRWEEID